MSAWGRKALALIRTAIIVVVGLVIIVFTTESLTKQKVPVGITNMKSVYVGAWDSGYFSLTGTWELEGERSFFPIQASEITCYRNEGFCTEAQAYILDGFLTVALGRYQITAWDGRTLSFTDSPTCFDYIYTVSRETKQVTGVRNPKMNISSIPECSLFSAKPLSIRLVNGFDVWMAETNNARPMVAMIIGFVLLIVWAGYRVWRIFRES